MIKEAQVLDQWPGELPCLKDKTFTFTRGLNVIFGPNGSGKTTLLRTIASYTGCPEKGGWSAYTNPSGCFGISKEEKNSYPECFRGTAPGKAKASVVWDGTPTFLHMSRQSDEKLLAFGMDDNDLMTDMERLWEKDISAGEQRLKRIARLMDVVKSPPDLTNPSMNHDHNNAWTNAQKRFVEHINSLPKDGPSTVLLDEPIRSIDIIGQVAFWTNLIPKLVKDHQVIVTTHSPILLMNTGYEMNFIDIASGYAEDAVDFLSAFMDNKPTPRIKGAWWLNRGMKDAMRRKSTPPTTRVHRK